LASVNFLFRSTKPKAFLNLRLLYRYNNKDFSFGGKTKLLVTENYWKNIHFKRVKDIGHKNLQKEIGGHLSELEHHILNKFYNTNQSRIDKTWLQKVVESYYSPELESENEWPNELISYLDKYIELKSKDLRKQSIKNYKVVKNLLIRYESSRNIILRFSDINLNFKDDFEEYCRLQQYSENSINKALSTIKTVCNDAVAREINVNNQFRSFKITNLRTENIYLNFSEISDIIKLKDLPSFLDNAKDWLVISCFTGQRISDFMNFSSDNLRYHKDQVFLDFTQVKTNTAMSIPLHHEVLKILDRNNGNFPHKISDQKYNSYIKKVSEKAKINSLSKGKKSINISKIKGKSVIRRQEGIFPKYELVSSHIGRRSFATNFYGKMPTTYIMYITGHSTEKMLLKYIGKSNTDMAFDAGAYINKIEL